MYVISNYREKEAARFLKWICRYVVLQDIIQICTYCGLADSISFIKVIVNNL